MRGRRKLAGRAIWFGSSTIDADQAGFISVSSFMASSRAHGEFSGSAPAGSYMLQLPPLNFWAVQWLPRISVQFSAFSSLDSSTDSAGPGKLHQRDSALSSSGSYLRQFSCFCRVLLWRWIGIGAFALWPGIHVVSYSTCVGFKLTTGSLTILNSPRPTDRS
ncbi:hypothetical protein C8R47DRAFT_659560 [Mycena vitilis]|nr:hypothetical protein C8R47DRAFT_659560 [Mycena vitilis]